MKPIIGIVPGMSDDGMRYIVRKNYLDMITQAGGIPLTLPWCDDAEAAQALIERCDGLVLSGGNDVSPERYGEQKLPECGSVTPERDTAECLFTEAALRADKPIFAICRGIQALNVALGGTLYQDLPSQVSADCTMHNQSAPYQATAHTVRIVEETPLHALLGTTEIAVNSSHHQAVKAVAAGLRPMAYAPQGFVEAVFAPERRCVWGVQWHPEYLVEASAAPDIRAQQCAILEAFVGACNPGK